MKKLISIILSLLLVLSLTIGLAQETITVATNAEYPPFEYVDEKGEIVGYDIDLIKEVAKIAGLDIKVEGMAFDAITAAVVTNKNIIGLAGISITDERKLSVNFSEGYINAGLSLIVKTDSPIKSEKDLMDKMVGAQLGTTSELKAEEYVGIQNVATYKSFIDAVKDLQGNKIDAVIVDKPVGLAILAGIKDDSLVSLDMELEADFYGIEVNKDNIELLDKINEALKVLKENGFMEELNKKYFAAE